MSKKFSMDIWKFLSGQMTFEEKKKLIRDNDIQIKGFHGSLRKTDSQWQMAIRRFETELKSAKIQTALVLFYVEKLEAEKLTLGEEENETALQEREDCFEGLQSKSIEEIKADIEEHGKLEEVLIHLIVLGEKAKANALVELLSKENAQQKRDRMNDIEAEGTKSVLQKRIQELEQSLAKAEASERKLKKTNRSLERKYNDILEKKNSEIRGWEKRLAEAKGIQEELQNEREMVKLLEEEKTAFISQNNELNSQLEALEIERKALEDDLHLTAGFMRTDSSEFKQSKEGVKNVLVFGDVPIMVRKDPAYHIHTFDGDCFAYDFADEYDEYWFVVDKLSPKMRLELSRNEHAADIKWEKMLYSDAFGRREVMSI